VPPNSGGRKLALVLQRLSRAIQSWTDELATTAELTRAIAKEVGYLNDFEKSDTPLQATCIVKYGTVRQLTLAIQFSKGL
jgi:hypothetical protein